MDKAKLWQALSTKEGLDQWFIETEIDLKIKGKYTFKDGWKGWIDDFKTLEYIQFNSAEQSYTRFEIHALGNELEFRLIDRLKPDLNINGKPGTPDYQPGGVGTHGVGLLAGWHDFADALMAYVSGEEIQDHFDQLCVF